MNRILAALLAVVSLPIVARPRVDAGPCDARLLAPPTLPTGGRRVGGQPAPVGSEALGENHGDLQGHPGRRRQEPKELLARELERCRIGLGLDRGTPQASIEDSRFPEQVVGRPLAVPSL
jgi:hypothetical protein